MLHKKLSFPLKILLVNVTKCAVKYLSSFSTFRGHQRSRMMIFKLDIDFCNLH